MKHSKTIIAATLGGLFAVSSAAHAGVVVDLFTDPAAGQYVDTRPAIITPTIVEYSQVGNYPASIIGGYRDLGITQTAGDAGQYSGATVIGGVLSIANDPTVKSETVVTWDGANAAGQDGSAVDIDGLGGIDLTVGGATQLEAIVKYADLGFDYTITVWDMDGDRSSLSASVQFAVPDGNTELAHYLFDWFNLANGTYCDGVSSPPSCTDPLTELDFTIDRSGGAIDFTRIGALQLLLENPNTTSVDFQLRAISTNVPEPATIALLGVGLLAAGGAVRRRKQSPAT